MAKTAPGPRELQLRQLREAMAEAEQRAKRKGKKRGRPKKAKGVKQR